MSSPNAIKRLEEKAALAEETIAYLKREIASLKEYTGVAKSSSDQKCKELDALNKKLSEEIDAAMQQLIRLEVANGKLQVPISSAVKTNITVPTVVNAPKIAETKNTEPAKSKENKKAQQQSEETAAGKAKKPKKVQPPKQPEKAEDDVTRLDLRVGLILTAERHPDADSLYVEKIDVGAEQQLTVVSGLAGRIPLEEMQNRPVILLCNLKPAKMRGIVSQAMVMCASDPSGKVEILCPPPGSAPGDRVALEGEEPTPPDTQLKGKVWEAVAAKLRTRSDLVAAFDGKALTVPGKGNITTNSLAGVPIK